jgi:RNA polymerase sigma-70 factor (ECF subfamily)
MAPSNPDSEVRLAEADLIARCRRGDASAFEELYNRHASRLYNLAFRMVGNGADAEDLLQDIFLTAYRKLDTFKGESSLGTWLYRLGVNACLDHLRSRAARKGQATDPFDENESSSQSSAGATPAELIVGRVDLERAIRLLPEGCRAAFLLHDVEGFDHTQVGEILGIAEGTSKSQVHKARLRLRTLLSATSRA